MTERISGCGLTATHVLPIQSLATLKSLPWRSRNLHLPKHDKSNLIRLMFEPENQNHKYIMLILLGFNLCPKDCTFTVHKCKHRWSEKSIIYTMVALATNMIVLNWLSFSNMVNHRKLNTRKFMPSLGLYPCNLLLYIWIKRFKLGFKIRNRFTLYKVLKRQWEDIKYEKCI